MNGRVKNDVKNIVNDRVKNDVKNCVRMRNDVSDAHLPDEMSLLRAGRVAGMRERGATVGGYFDVSNMLKYGVSSAEWIRKTGKRLLKIDCKGWSKEKGFGEIGTTGDENWPEVLQALYEVKYPGEFLTAEVKGGGRERLLEISKQLDQVLQLT